MTNKIHNPELKEVKQNGKNSAIFVIEPVESGYGTTLGNSLRRVLLSSIEGAAVTAFKLDGAPHEYAALPGIKEDVLDISLNLKSLSISAHLDGPEEIHVEKKGGVLTAGDLKLTGDMAIGDPDQVILTIDDPKKTVKLDLMVESGRGYRSVEVSAEKRTRADMIALDAMFTPVTRVRHTVEATRAGKVSGLDKLLMTVDTDGTITPEDAFEQAAAILVNQYQALAGQTQVVSAPAYGSKEEMNEEKLAQSIEALNFTARTFNSLDNNGIKTLQDLVSLGENELNELKGFGAKAAEEVREKLAELEF